MFETTDDIDRRRRAFAWYEALSAEEQAIVDELLTYHQADGELSGDPDALWQRYWQLHEQFRTVMDARGAERSAAVQRTAEDVTRMRGAREQRYRENCATTTTAIRMVFPRCDCSWMGAVGYFRRPEKLKG